MTDRLKSDPDSTNEVHDFTEFIDQGECRLTPVMTLDPRAAQAVVEGLGNLVRAAHTSGTATSPDREGIVRAQTFEEGDVYMLESPFTGFFADRYVMDFFDVASRGICSRMHFHTGLRFVRMMTGNETCIQVSSLSPLKILGGPVGGDPIEIESFTDKLPDGFGESIRYNAVVPPNTWADLQIPRGTSHQFNAFGPNAIIDSVHPEESIETLREEMSGFRMMAQTVFLGADSPSAEQCGPMLETWNSPLQE
ncbi:hypothetical protein [Streptomyces fildesensis]|uniref:hypothetical protein n=1 Tax=Streptomyces fildesensis TaxID=375757 RepID=UPI0018DFF7C9|nr:hypothetical protein [Streptomyces fildesensis]